MILICKEITDFSTYSRTQTNRVIKPIGINVQRIVSFHPINLWKDGNETVNITKMLMDYQNEPLYLEHSFEQMRGMLFGMTLVHDYRVEHGTHFVRCQAYPVPNEEEDDETSLF